MISIVTGVVALVLGVLFSVFKVCKVMDTLVFISILMITTGPTGINIVLFIALMTLAKKMAMKYVLVKDLDSASRLGDVSCIIADKTGTLT